MSLLEKRLLSRREASYYVGLGLNKGVEFCNKSGARIELKGRVMYDKRILDAYIDTLTMNTSKEEEDGSEK